MRKLLRYLFVLVVLCVVVGLWLTRAKGVDPDDYSGLTGNPEAGALVFAAAGCASCHLAPEDDADGPPVLAGGYRIKSPFGTFVAPNISPSSAGIAGWSTVDMANALIAGVSPDGRHLYPSLPYATYVRMTPQDVADLKSYMDTLPPSDSASVPHDLGFPFTIRRGLGLWKLKNVSNAWVLTNAATPLIQRGRYLVEALGHCAECHTPRDVTGGLDKSQWMQGAPNPSGDGKIPGIHPSQLDWSEGDIAYYLETGFTPDFDSAGGQMTDVIRGLAKLPAEDRTAIAAYLKALP